MFNSESELQDLVDNNPHIITDALIELSPTLNGIAVPKLFSLGREISLSSGRLDNLYIDAHGILTIVECKLYNNPDMKREVYSQVINYTADIQADLRNYTNRQGHEDFSEAFQSALIESSQDPKYKEEPKYKDFQEMVEDLKTDPYLSRYDKSKWEEQFKIRLEQNIKSGIFRVIIACGEKSDRTFHLSKVRNLMKIMQFSENKSNLYDISLVDIRKINNQTVSKVIWRRYSELPMVPVIATSTRNTTATIEQIPAYKIVWPTPLQELLDNLIQQLETIGITVKQNTQGYALHEDKSTWIYIHLEPTLFYIRRDYISPNEQIYDAVHNKTIPTELTVGIKYQPIRKKKAGEYKLRINVTKETDVVTLAKFIKYLSIRSSVSNQ